MDQSQPHHQMVVEADQSQHLLTNNTHRGLHHCTPLPFGMALVLALFQKAPEQILQGTEGDNVDLDDLQVTGAQEEECMHQLDVLVWLEQRG